MNTFEVGLACCLAFVLGCMLSATYKRRSAKEQVEMGEQLMSAINKAQQDVLVAYKMINEMEAVNMTLRTENHQLKAENMDLKASADELRAQLNDALDNIYYLQQAVGKYFPKSATPPKNDTPPKQ